MLGFSPLASAPLAGSGVTSAAYSLSADHGSFALTGQTANLVKALNVEGATGSFALTGQAANLLSGVSLTADHGSFALTGQTAGLNKALNVTAGTGSLLLQVKRLILTKQSNTPNLSLIHI